MCAILNPVATTGSSMRIGEAARSSGCHLETIRYYERIGLLTKPQRQTNGYRRYSLGEVARLKFITRSRDLGFSLDEVRDLVRLAEAKDRSCEEVDRLAREQLSKVEGRIGELQVIARELTRTIEACANKSCGDCAILDALQR